MNQDWLENLKVADTVFVSRGSGLFKTKVERFTKTLIISKGGFRFRRSCGSALGGGSWTTNHLLEPTKEVLVEYQEQVYKSKLRYCLDTTLSRRKNIPRELGEQIIKLLKDFVKDE